MKEPINYLPAPELQAYIATYGILEIQENITEPYFSSPLGLSGFILQTTNTQNKVIAKLMEDDFFTDNAVVTGQVTQPVYGQITGEVRSILVFFQPLGMHQLFGTDMATLTNNSASLHNFLGSKKSRIPDGKTHRQ